MADGLMDTSECRCLEVSLINGIAHDEHIIDTDTDEQEGDENVHVRLLGPTDKHESKPSSVG